MSNAVEVLHIIAGAIGLFTGYIALFSTKGASAHRRAGTVFVVAMLAMCGLALLVMAMRWEGPFINVIAALLTSYLVVTALLAVREPSVAKRRFEVAGMCLALALAISSLTVGMRIARGAPAPAGVPPFPYFLFGVVAGLGALLDARMLRLPELKGSLRLSRHLWRMSFALFIAAMSFFLGQSDEFPRALRIFPVIGLPPLAVLLAMFYWLWRIRVRRTLRGVMLGRSAGPATKQHTVALHVKPSI